MKKLFLFAAVLLGMGTMNAQVTVNEQYPGDERAEKVYNHALDVQKDENPRSLRTTYVANRFRDNWFLSLQGGVSQMIDNDAVKMDFADQFNWSGGLSIGKWFSPVWGLRVSLNAAQVQGFYASQDLGAGTWYTGGANIDKTTKAKRYMTPSTVQEQGYIKQYYLNDAMTADGTKGYGYDVTYGAASVDFLWNMKNSFMGYNPKGFFNPVMYFGVGYAGTFPDGDEVKMVHNVMAKGGLQFNFRLGRSVDLFLDGSVMAVPESFDRLVGKNRPIDLIGNYNIGLNIKFPFQDFIRADFNDPALTRDLNNKINDLRRENEELRNRPLPVCPECPEQVVVVEEAQVSFLPTPVFFSIGSAKITANQYYAIEQAAKFLKDNPNHKLQLTGYADKQTGTASFNKELSEQRVKAVADMLVNKYGINRNRLEIDAKGDIIQPFDHNDWNRVVLFVAE